MLNLAFFNSKANKQILGFIFLVIIFRGLLDYVYATIIVVRYDYQHYIYNPDLFSIIISWFFLISLLPSLFTNFKGEKLSNLVLYLFGLCSIVPTSTMIGFNSQYSFKYVLLIYIYWSLIFFYNKIIPTLYLKFKLNSRLAFYAIILLIILALLYISYVYTGFRFHFGLMDVYELRVEAREYNVPFIFNYFLAAADYVLIFVLIYNLLYKNYLFAWLLFILNLLNFGISGSKHIVFLLFLSLLVFFVVKVKDVKIYFLPFLTFILILSILEFVYFDTNFLTLFLSYRVLIIPSKLHFIYFEYFSAHEFDYFRQSFMKFLMDSPYKYNIGFLIGEYDTGDIDGRANNGLFSDAYFNLGTFGVLIFPIFLVFLLKLFDGASMSLNTRLYFSIGLSLFLALLSLPLTVAFLSSGIFIFLVLLYSIPYKNSLVNI